MALAFDPANKGIMDRKPIKNDTIFTKGMTWRIVYQGIMIGLITLVAFIVGLATTNTPIEGLSLQESKIEVAQTMAFITLAFSELVHVFNIRNNKESVFKTKIFNNSKLLLAITVSALLMLVILFVPALRGVFSIPVLPKDNIIEIVLIVLSPLVIVEFMKLIKCNGTKGE